MSRYSSTFLYFFNLTLHKMSDGPTGSQVYEILYGLRVRRLFQLFNQLLIWARKYEIVSLETQIRRFQTLRRSVLLWMNPIWRLTLWQNYPTYNHKITRIPTIPSAYWPEVLFPTWVVGAYGWAKRGCLIPRRNGGWLRRTIKNRTLPRSGGSTGLSSFGANHPK